MTGVWITMSNVILSQGTARVGAVDTWHLYRASAASKSRRSGVGAARDLRLPGSPGASMPACTRSNAAYAHCLLSLRLLL
jgi:hypothetical protein